MPNYLMPHPRRLLNVYLRQWRFLSRLLFGVTIPWNLRGHGDNPSRVVPRIHWDFTTIMLKRCLVELVKPWHEVLEIGTGPYAILSISLAKRVRCRITACDVNEQHLRDARRVVVANNVMVKLLQSDLFHAVEGQFDFIFFNAVYIPRDVGRKLGIDGFHERETDWCGGEAGTEVIERFLRDAPAHLKDGGRVLLGFNPRYLPEHCLTELREGCGYNLIGRYTMLFNPSVVHALRRR